jgi:Arc/MetJ family transcription regulator
MSRTNIDLDDDLVAEAMRRFDLPTKKSAVEFALRRLLANRVDAEFIRSLEGIGWDGDLDEMRSADPVEEW